MLTARRKGRKTAVPTGTGKAPPKAERKGSPSGGLITKISLWAILAILLIYTVFVVLRIDRAATPEPSAAASDATLLAARLEGQATTLNAALTAAAVMATRDPQSPMDAAEAGLAASGGAAKAIAIIGAGGIQAQTSSASGADWRAAVESAQLAGREFWVGAPSGKAGPVYAVRTTTSGPGAAAAVAVIDLGRLLPRGARDTYAAIVASDGSVLASTGGGSVAEMAPTLDIALHVSNRTSNDTVIALGRLPGGADMEVAQRGVLDGLLGVAVAVPPGGGAAAIGPVKQESIFQLLAPLIIGLGLALLLTVQIRRANEAMKAHADTEQRFKLAVEAARCGIWEWDLKQDRVMMSDVTGVILGWGGGGVAAGQEVLARIAPDHRERVRDALLAARTHGAFDVSFRAPKQDGRSIWVDARGQAVPGQAKGEYDRIVGVAMDVTEERFAQARAQAAENRLRDAIESVSEAFVLWDRQGRLLLCNSNYRSFFNLEARVLKPGSSKDSVERFVRLAIQNEEPSPDGRRGVREALLNDGRWLQISERRTADGGLVVTAADITAIKTQDEARRINEEKLKAVVDDLRLSESQLAELARKYEAEKVRAEGANTAKSEFLANMSHELRTPLNAINGFSEIMVGEMFGPLGDGRYKEYARDILHSGQHLLALINDILDMSKIEAGKMTLRFEPLQFQEVVEDAVRLMRNRADAAGLNLRVDLPALPDIDADYRALKQVLLNLLSNALKFTPRGGSITVTGLIETNMTKDRLKVSVTDTGIGIESDDLARLARPFEQIETQHSKSSQGTGLGLALSKSLVEMHGGALNMSSEPGVGTTVSFAIPFRQDGAASRTYAA